MKIVELINEFPLTETKNRNRMFVLKTGVDFVVPISIKKNPNARGVYFIKLNQHDLSLLREIFSNDDIDDDDMQHNEFAVRKYQIKESFHGWNNS